MRIAVIGAGAIGGMLAVRLAHDVRRRREHEHLGTTRNMAQVR